MNPPRTSTLNTKSIRREIIQIIFLDLKGHWNQTSKPSKTSTNHKLVKLYGFKPLNFRHEHSNTKNIRSKIIQTTYLDLKVHWNQAQKPLETSKNHKSMKLYGFKPLKPRRTSTTNLQRRRTHQEHEEYTKNTKNAKNKGFLTSS